MIHQRGSVSLDPRFVSDLLCNTLGRLQNTMEVIVLEKFGLAESQYVNVNIAMGQFRPKFVSPLCRFRNRGGNSNSLRLSLLVNRQSVE